MFEFCKRTTKSNLPVALRWAVVILVVGLVATFTRITRATPVTFAFEAEITSIIRSPDATFDLPSNVTIGDDLSGLLQFEPFDFGQSSEASTILSINLGTEVFSRGGSFLTTLNNSSTFPAAEPQIMDGIGLGCPSLVGSVIGACAVDLSSSSDDIELRGIGLWQSSNVSPPQIGGDLIALGESLGDPDVWNRLLNRRFFMDFTSNSGPGSIRIEATYGPMIAIPEPSSLMLMMLMMLGILSLTRTFSRPFLPITK